jgi:NAD(P)H-dependent FMN reductase
MYNLKIISSTVRPGRKGPMIAAWIAEKASQTGEFEVEILDLGEINLPMMNEANHPIMKKYEHEHTRNWSAKIEAADAFIFVTAEYNHNYPAPLRNAIEYLFSEWNYKAAGIVSYGGISAGTRAANNLKGDLASMSMIPLVHGVNFSMFPQFITEEGEFVPNENSHKSAETMLIELIRWTKGLKAVKENK